VSWLSIPLEENDVNHHLPPAITMGAVTAIALAAAALIASMPAYADDEPFVSSRTREEVTAEIRTPYPGGNPWSGSYNMFQAPSTTTSEQVQGEYIKNQEQARAFHGEDSGSAYMMKAQASPAPGPTGSMGASAR
jgi:hypothetical protein